MAKEQKAEGKQAKTAAPPLRLPVTLVQKGGNAYDVLRPDGTPLKCKCGRPVQASLHNVSVTERLKPCGLVVPVAS